MTIIYSFATPHFAIQVADRLLTMQDGTTFDQAANKTVVYRCADAMVSISFTGTAYLAGTPTDRWLAELLWDRPVEGFEPDAPATYAVSSDPSRPVRRIRDVLRDVRTALGNLRHPAGAEPVSLGLVGWALRARRWSPIQYVIAPSRQLSSGRFPYSVRAAPKAWEAGGMMRLEWLPPRTDLDQIREAFYAQIRGATLEQVRDALASMVRSTSLVAKRVGPDCLTVSIPRPDVQKVVEVRYFAAGQGPVVHLDGRAIRAGYSTWCVGRNSLHAPSMVIGQTSMWLDDYQLFVVGPEDPGDNRGSRIFGYASGMTRPSWPPAHA